MYRVCRMRTPSFVWSFAMSCRVGWSDRGHEAGLPVESIACPCRHGGDVARYSPRSAGEAMGLLDGDTGQVLDAGDTAVVTGKVSQVIVLNAMH